MTRRALLLAAVVACGGHEKTTAVTPAPSASAAVSNTSEPAVGDAGVPRIDPEAVRKVVRNAAPHFMLCYAPGVKKKRDLAGRVETKFVIDETGHVISAEDVTHSNVLPDDAVRACIVSKFRNLEFPPPQPSGKVPITYPLLLDPSMVASAVAPTATAEQTSETVGAPRPFDAAGAAGVLGNVDLKACARAGFHGQGHVKVTFDPSGRVAKAELDTPASAAKTAGGACVTKAFGAAQVPAFDGSAVTVGKSFHVP